MLVTPVFTHLAVSAAVHSVAYLLSEMDVLDGLRRLGEEIVVEDEVPARVDDETPATANNDDSLHSSVSRNTSAFRDHFRRLAGRNYKYIYNISLIWE